MLKLATKGAVRFEWSDGIEETTVTLNPGDDEETLKRKLERILSLSHPNPNLPKRLPGFALGMAQEQHPPMVVTEEQGMAMKRESPGSVVNGWAPYAGAGLPHPEIPEGAEYELIPPEEQG
jgi:hypothetical protein